MNKEKTMVSLQCKHCGKTPAELSEYVIKAEIEGCTPNEFVWREEGTLNQSTGYFYCTSCYIQIGMPLGKA